MAETLSPDQVAARIIERANGGYTARDDYPPYAVTPWDDRLRWSAYIEKVAAEVVAEVMPFFDPPHAETEK